MASSVQKTFTKLIRDWREIIYRTRTKSLLNTIGMNLFHFGLNYSRSTRANFRQVLFLTIEHSTDCMYQMRQKAISVKNVNEMSSIHSSLPISLTTGHDLTCLF